MIVLSSNRNLDFCRTSSYEEAKKKEEKNVVVPPVASITSVVIPSGKFVNL